jgi:carbamoyl-phosphate synthase small subunit
VGRGEPALLALEDGSVFPGRSVGASGEAFGEAVFTTAMSGYQEVVTDPSFAEQLVCFTAPMVGNYGVACRRSESEAAHSRAVLMRRCGGADWADWLACRGVVALEDVDTRALVQLLRERGAMRAAAVVGDVDIEDVLLRVRAQPRMVGRSLVAGVSTREPYVFGAGRGRLRIAVLDYGCKRSILYRLEAAGAHVTVLPHDLDATEILGGRYDGLLLSNGPGDPAALAGEVAVVRGLLSRVPILGICLGHQLLALAAGLETFKLPFGHRGANHPVQDLRTGRVLVTSQNHGFAVRGEAECVTHASLYDGTVEGLALPGERARSVQFHPEAGPGPHDAWPILEGWLEELRLAEAA